MKQNIPLHRSMHEQGFALPVAIGLGLVMLLLGVTMIVRSQNDQVNASAQKATAESLAAAEVGVSKVQTFLNLYRVLATVPSTGSSSWANRASIDVNNIVNASCNAGDVAEDVSDLYPSGGDWPNVDPNDTANPPAQGEFQVVDYTYDVPNSRGTLTVQGRVNAGQPGESIAQVQVEIPVRLSNPPAAAALWVRDSITGTLGVGPDVTVVGPCGLADVPSATNNIRTNQWMPAVPPAPSSATTLANLTQPLGDSNPDDDVVTTYSTTSGALSSGSPIRVLSESNVEIWVSDNNDINWANQQIQCLIRVSPDIACNAGDSFKVTVYATGTSKTLQLNSQSVLCNLHFHAPGYNVQFTDTGSPTKSCGVLNSRGQPTRLNGSFWVNRWDGGTGSILLDQSTAANEIALPPQIEPVARWERQEVSP
jgi:hypothetical protein